MASLVPDITENLPADIATSLDPTAAYPSDVGWDVTIGTLGFRLRPTQSAPYRRETDQVSKQQIDTSTEAGEQSLSTWWLRSQSSWHMGAGITWYEPGSEKDTEYRFADSCGVDPWTLGQIGLLRRCDPVATASANPVYLSTVRVGTEDTFLQAVGDQVIWTNGGWMVVEYTSSIGACQPATFGKSAWIGHNTGVAKFDLSADIITEPLTASAPCRAWWVKSRLIVAVGASLYEVPPAATGVTVESQKLLYTHPDPSWVWSDVDESGGAVLACGFADSESAIFRFTIANDATTGLPVLSDGGQVTRMPPGEQLHAMKTYLGAYIVLGTTSGARVGTVSAAGDVQYGPITVPTTHPVVNMTFRDRFAYVVATACQPDGTTGAARIDLSSPVGTSGRYAWAWDASTGTTGEASSICFVGSQDRVVMGTVGYRFMQSATQFVTSGWLQTGNIRYKTVEQKAFRLARMVCELNAGQVDLTAVTPDGAENRVFTYSAASATSGDVGIQIPGRPINQYLSFRMTFTPSADGLATPLVSGLSVKAVPAASRMRLVQFPVSLYDTEVARSGRKYGRKGGALQRLLALEALEDAAIPVLVRHLASGDAFLGLVESTAFSSSEPPDRTQSGFGGVALVTIRKL